jgi:AhpD family alkylhydroperoxidase
MLVSYAPFAPPRQLIQIKADHSTAWNKSTSLTGEVSMYDHWPETTKVLSAQLRNLRGGAPDVMKAFSAIAQTALAPKALDAKTKELIALGIGIAIRCDDCIAFHIKAAVERGATHEEISETLGMAIYMGAGPSVMYASHAFAALQQFEAEKTVQSG